MDIQIHNVANDKWKTILIKHGIAFLSKQTYSRIERFEAEIKDSRFANEFEAFPLSNITEIKFNDHSEEVDILYLNKEDKEKIVSLKIGHANLAQDFGNNLGKELGLAKSTRVEKKWKIIVKNSIFLLVCVVIPILAYSNLGNTKDKIWEFTAFIVIGFCLAIFNLVRKLMKPTNYTNYLNENEILSLEDQPLKLKLPLLKKK